MKPVQQIATAIAADHGVALRQLLGRERTPIVSAARFALYRKLHDGGWSALRIGKALGRDHTTVLHGLRRAEQLSRVQV